MLAFEVTWESVRLTRRPVIWTWSPRGCRPYRLAVGVLARMVAWLVGNPRALLEDLRSGHGVLEAAGLASWLGFAGWLATGWVDGWYGDVDW